METKEEEVEDLVRKLQAINQLNFSSIIWTKNGKIVKYPKKMIDDFNFTGLSNADFICSDFRKQ